LVQDAVGCDAYLGFIRWIRGTESMSRSPGALPCPVRIAWGERDKTIPFDRYGRPVLDALPGAEQVTVPGVGHIPMYDNPRLVVETILEVTATPDRTGATRVEHVH
jgi:pimeloyl-ACP methyl ester carboxylesterase